MNWVTINALIEMTKPRLSFLALLMGALGFAIASFRLGYTSFEAFDWSTLVWTMVGMTFIGACSGALNQWLESPRDKKMNRTCHRPLPSGRVTQKQALVFGLATGLLGELILLIWVNPVTSVLGALTLLFYLGIYTPSKPISSTSTLIGAIPGAMPPLMGWTAAYGTVNEEGLLLFAILFLWQIPHFLAIAWMYREDYAKAEFRVLNVVDNNGNETLKQMFLYSLALFCMTLIPTLWGLAGRIYFFGALGLGLAFLACVCLVAFYRNDIQARRLFRASLLYLPLLGFFMIWDRIH